MRLLLIPVIRQQALYKAQQQLLLTESPSRSTRLVLSKAGKAIAKANTRAAQLKAENQRFRHQLDSTSTFRVRKRVQINLNERFSNVEASRLQLIALQFYKLDRQANHLKQQLKKQQQRLVLTLCVLDGKYNGCR
jgi:hypothetical protein